jgi:hypothetical protein
MTRFFGLAVTTARAAFLFALVTPSLALSTQQCGTFFVLTTQTYQPLAKFVVKGVTQIQSAIARNPQLGAGSSVTWTTSANGLEEQFTLSKSTDGTTYSLELEMAIQSSNPTFVVVSTTSLVNVQSSPMETAGNFNIDFDALASVQTTSPYGGQAAASYDFINDSVKGIKQVINLNFTNFLVSASDPNGPLNGTAVSTAEPGTGLALQFATSLVLSCPANPKLETSDLLTVDRQYLAFDGTYHSCWDGKATGGQIAAGDTEIQLVCAQGNTSEYFLLKKEDASGNTLFGNAAGPGTCDFVFGSVPDLTDSANDYNFNSAVTFPNEW